MLTSEQLSTIESILLLATKPLSAKELAKAVGAEKEAIAQAMEALNKRYLTAESGIRLLQHESTYQLVSAPQNAQAVESFYHSEMSGELTKPALETLTIIAYRGPISKPELELIRGINCSLILRNLSMRGLVQQQGTDDITSTYIITPEFLQYLGMTSVTELPEYEPLHAHELLDELLKQRSASQS